MVTNRKINVVNSIDWVTVVLYLVLVAIGWINIYAASYQPEHSSIIDLSQRYGKQLLWIAMAFLLIIAIMIIDSSFYSYFAYPIYGFIILLLISVLIFGKEINGARAWFEIGSFKLQPSELAKFATCLALAKYLSSDNLNISKVNIFWILLSIFLFPLGLYFYIKRKNNFQLAPAFLIIFLPVMLIVLQNDVGSAIIYFALFLVLFREGLSPMFMIIAFIMILLFFATLIYPVYYIVYVATALSFIIFYLIRRKLKEIISAVVLISFFTFISYLILKLIGDKLDFYYLIIISFVISGPIIIFYAYRYKIRQLYLIYFILLGSFIFSVSVHYIYNDVLEDHQKNRIAILLGLKEDPKGVGYNVNQSKIAIGSGGFAGKGFLKGTQTKFDFVPEQTTDFIFCTVGEEWGFIGTGLVLFLFAFFLIRLIFIAERQRSKFSRIYGYGVVSIFFFHIVINIGMTIGLMPVIGIPLPFFSYGGSSLWSFTLLLFIFLRLDANRLQLLK
ncbi:MAG: rod shape-determining protein RodA [Marinilabiliales bacterium]